VPSNFYEDHTKYENDLNGMGVHGVTADKKRKKIKGMAVLNL